MKNSNNKNEDKIRDEYDFNYSKGTKGKYARQVTEDIEDIKLFDIAQKNDDGERIQMEEAFRKIETQRSH